MFNLGIQAANSVRNTVQECDADAAANAAS